MYNLSSFNRIIFTEYGDRMYNSVTKKSIGYNKLVEELLPPLCRKQINKLEKSLSDRFLQIIVAELLCRGIIIPINQVNNELEYLNSISPLQLPEHGFFNCKTLDLELIDKKQENNIIFFGVPCDLGSSRPGSRYGPRLLRSKSNSLNFRSKSSILLDMFKYKELNTSNLLDLGDINITTSNLDNWMQKIKNLICKLPQKSIPFMIGGDHTFTLPVIQSLWKSRSPFTLIQLDQHLDIQIWGEFKDVEPKYLDPLSHSNFVSWIKHYIPEINILQVGVSRYQSVGNSQYIDNVKKYLDNISNVITDFEIQNNNISSILSKVPKEQNIYLSIDIDVINSIFIRDKTGFPGPMGIDLEKFIKLVNFIISNNKIVGVDIMEYGISDKTESHSSSSTIIVNAILNILQNIR